MDNITDSDNLVFLHPFPRLMGTIKSCHDVRRTVITRMYHKIVKNDCPDANLKMLQVFAGHSTLQQTLDYVRADSDDQLVPTELINSLYA